jgi:hypothetical protein
MKTRVHGARLLLSAGTAVTLAIGMLAGGQTAYAAGPTPVGLGAADSYAVLGGSTITNTGPTTITGDIGLSPGKSYTGSASVTLHGTANIANAAALNAQNALTTAYNDAAGRTPVTANVPAELGGRTLTAGVYTSIDGTFHVTGVLTLDMQGDPNAVFIFKTASTLTTASGSSVVFTNGSGPCNVFWQITSSATIGTGSHFQGTIMSLSSITMTTGATLIGRALARNGAVTLDTNVISNLPCSGGPAPAPTAGGSASPGASASPSATATPRAPAVTPAPTSTVSDGSTNNSTPLLPLMIVLGLVGLVLGAFVTQRRRIRR